MNDIAKRVKTMSDYSKIARRAFTKGAALLLRCPLAPCCTSGCTADPQRGSVQNGDCICEPSSNA